MATANGVLLIGSRVAKFVRRHWTLMNATALVASLMTPAVGVAADPAGTFESALNREIVTALERHPATRVVVDIRLDGDDPIFMKYGPQESRTSLNQQSIFQIGSITKVFTGVLLASAVERGECALSEPANNFLPAKLQLPGRGTFPITFQELATHTSGLPRLPPDFTFSSALRLIPVDDPYSTLTEDSLKRGISLCSLKKLESAPFSYSNLGMGLLGHALSHHAGMSYEALLQRDITSVLGMPDTVITLSEEQKSRFVTGRNSVGKETRPWKFAMLEGAGALYSTSDDLHRFLLAQQLDPTTPVLKAMATARQRHAKSNGTDEVGLGWMISNAHMHPSWWHNGATFGHTSFFSFSQEPKFAVVILCGEGFNPLTSKPLADEIALKIIPLVRSRATSHSESPPMK